MTGLSWSGCEPGFMCSSPGQKNKNRIPAYGTPVIKKDISRYVGAAGRAVESIIPYALVPRGKPNADGRFGIVDPAVDFPVVSPVIERAMGECPAIKVHPVIDPGNL